MIASLSKLERETLKSVYRLSRDGRDTHTGALAEFLDTLGLRPGVRVEVREKHPFDGPIVLRVNGKDRTLGEKVAHHIYVTKERSA